MLRHGDFAFGLVAGISVATFGYLVIERFDWYEALTASNISTGAATLAAIATCAAAVAAARSAKLAEQAGLRSLNSELRSAAAQLRGQIDYEQAKAADKATRASKLHNRLFQDYNRYPKFSYDSHKHGESVQRIKWDAQSYAGLSAQYSELRSLTFGTQDNNSFTALQDGLYKLNLDLKKSDTRHRAYRADAFSRGSFSEENIPLEMDALSV